jgi:hypothetical protein
MADLSMHLGGVSEFGVEVGLESLLGAEFGGGEAVGVGFEGMGLDLSEGEGWEGVVGVGVILCVGGEEVDDRYGGWFGLSVCEVVVCEACLVEHAALGLVGWSAFGQVGIGR